MWKKRYARTNRQQPKRKRPVSRSSVREPKRNKRRWTGIERERKLGDTRDKEKKKDVVVDEEKERRQRQRER